MRLADRSVREIMATAERVAMANDRIATCKRRDVSIQFCDLNAERSETFGRVYFVNDYRVASTYARVSVPRYRDDHAFAHVSGVELIKR